MNRVYVAIIVGSLALAIFLPFFEEDESNLPAVKDELIEGTNEVVNIAEEVRFEVLTEQAMTDTEAERERLRELGYPDGYNPDNPVANGEFTADDYDAMMKEDAMRSIAEDAMRDEAMMDDRPTGGHPVY